MSSLTIYSPYDGQPVQVRPQDVGRAIRDGQGLIFYVLPTSDRQGHYASRTRHGSANEEEEYQKRLATMAASGSLPKSAQVSQAIVSANRSPLARWAWPLAVVLALAIGAVAWWLMTH